MKEVLNLEKQEFISFRPYVQEIIFNGLNGTDLTFTMRLSELGVRVNKQTNGKLAEKIFNAVYDLYIEEE